MCITITPMTTEAELLGKAYVHWKSWQETYRGLIDDNYLDHVMTLEKCETIARCWPQNLWVAKDGERVVGFVGCGRNDVDCGEVHSIYVLREYQGQGVGRALMEMALAQLCDCRHIMLWVLRGNERLFAFIRAPAFFSTGKRSRWSSVRQ